MAIRITAPNGVIFEVETVAEALAIQRGQDAPPEPTAASARKPRKRNGAQRVRREPEPTPVRLNLRRSRIHGLSDGSIKLLHGIQKMGAEELITQDFAARLGLSPKQLPPLFMQLRKEIRKVDLPMEAVVRRRKVYIRGRAKSVYSGGPAIAEALRRSERANLF